MDPAARRPLAIAGGIALLIGLALGLAPASASTSSGTVACGSPWVPDYRLADAAQRGDELGGDLLGLDGGSSVDRRQQCRDAFGARPVLGGIAAGLGGVALAGAAMLGSSARRPDAA